MKISCTAALVILSVPSTVAFVATSRQKNVNYCPLNSRKVSVDEDGALSSVSWVGPAVTTIMTGLTLASQMSVAATDPTVAATVPSDNPPPAILLEGK